MQSIERAFAVLRVLSLGPAGVTEIADQTGVPKSTVSRLLSALEREGAVEQRDSGGAYRVGSGLVDLAGAVQPAENLVAIARPHLAELTIASGETSGLSVRSGRDVYYLDHVAAEAAVQVQDWTGQYARMHTVPSGLVLLATAGDDEIDRYLSGRLERTTERTVVDPDEIRARLAEIRAVGYCWVFEEFVEEINSVAVAVRGPSGDYEAAIHVHGPAYRFPNGERDRIADIVVDAAERLSERWRTT